MVASWRKQWHAASHGETPAAFPFGIVQLSANVDLKHPLQYTLLRWLQTGGTGALPAPNLPHTFLATAYDLGDATSPFGAVPP